VFDYVIVTEINNKIMHILFLYFLQYIVKDDSVTSVSKSCI